MPFPKNTKTKRSGVFRGASFGDVHLHHPNTPTRHITQNLDRYLVNDTVLAELDVLICTGDLFDNLLDNADEDLDLIHRWITRLLYKCAAHDVLLRIVEGTPSHDWRQSRFIIEQAQNANIPVDVHYAQTLEIEHIERFGIDVLYVPDKYHTDTSQTLEEIRVLLANKALDQVDFAVMHGAFTYQLPAIAKEPTHDEAAYHALVRYLIFIGHVHLVHPYGRILPAGSFDRMIHGEEGPKGYFRFEVRGVDDIDTTFVENRHAKRYDTLDVTERPIKEAWKIVTERAKALPAHSAIKVVSEPRHPILGDRDVLRGTYPKIEWTFDHGKTKASVEVDEIAGLADNLDELPPITPASVGGLLDEFLQRFCRDEDHQVQCQQRLNDIVEGA